MITASVIISTVVGLLGGATVGAVVTGLLGIKAKAKKRVQKRRELVYVDMLAWVYTRILMVRDKANEAATPSNGKLANLPPSATPAASPSATPAASPSVTPAPSPSATPARKSTFPDSMALDPHKDTDPGKPYFDTLHARVRAFGSHDMARAFDRWTKFYKDILDDPSSAKEFWFNSKITNNKITYADAIIPPDPPSHEKDLSDEPLATPPHAFARFTRWLTGRRQAKRDFKALNGRSRRRWDAGLPDPVKGGLTMAIERCASKELRKG